MIANRFSAIASIRRLRAHKPVFAFLFAALLLPSIGLAQGPVVDGGRGPVPIHVPPSYDPMNPAPLVLLLHGYGSTGPGLESSVQLTPLADEFGFLYLTPTGTSDFLGNPYWNATDACCDIFGSGIDDSPYLLSLIDAVKTQFSVDPRRVFLFGHSNGGFMSYRMACDHGDTIAAIVSLAGATYFNPLSCDPSGPVHILQIHGTADSVVSYDGGVLIASYPSAVETVEQWAQFNGCSLIPDLSPPPLDLDSSIGGAETTVARYATDCIAGGSAELWTMNSGVHSPAYSTGFGRLVVEHLLAHPKSAASGTVAGGISGIAPVLTINGEDRFVSVAPRAALTVSLAASTFGPSPAVYALWAWIGSSFQEVELAGRGAILGCTVNPTPLHPGQSPQPFACLRGSGLPPTICQGVMERNAPPTAPFSITLPRGLSQSGTFVLQGIVADDGAANGLGFSITNATILEVAP